MRTWLSITLQRYKDLKECAESKKQTAVYSPENEIGINRKIPLLAIEKWVKYGAEYKKIR